MAGHAPDPDVIEADRFERFAGVLGVMEPPAAEPAADEGIRGIVRMDGNVAHDITREPARVSVKAVVAKVGDTHPVSGAEVQDARVWIRMIHSLRFSSACI